MAMNILIFSWRGIKHPHEGGAERATQEHAKGWVKAGHNVTLFTSAYLGCKREEIIEGVKIIRSGSQILGVHIRALIWYLFANKTEFDLVIDQFHGIPFFTPLYIRSKKLAFIHEVAKEVWLSNTWPRPFNLIPAVLGFYFEQFIFKFFYKNIPFMTVSPSTKDDLIAWGVPDKNITVVFNGSDNPVRRGFTKEKSKTILFLGALSKDKGIEDALRIFSMLHLTNPDWQFWVAGKGEGNYLEKLKNMVKDFELENKVTFWGYVSENKKYELFSRAHILLNPSVREGWGLVIIEAASVGTPALGYNVAGLKDSIIDNRTGILSLPNPIDAAKKMRDLLNDEKKYKKMSYEALKWSSNFKWEKSIKDSLRLIVKIINNS